ncbi:MAG: succinylglutamate desuccinylase/aspartoacylase family protein [Myxococcota bacterium]
MELPVSILPTGSQVSIPVAVIHGRLDGPCVWISAAIHGDELNGVPVVRRVLRRIDPKQFAGTLILVPVVNVFGLINESRYLPDRRDLNRSFPGSARGSLASQLAHLFMTEVVHRCDFGLDLHSGSGGRTNLPQIRCDLDEPATRDAAMAFAPPIIVHSSLRDGSLREAAREHGVPVLLYETGEAKRFDRVGIDLGCQGALRVLHKLEMLRGEAPQAAKFPPVIARSTSWLRTRRGGFCEMRVELGRRVETGDTVAVVYDALSRAETKIQSHIDGFVIGHRSEALVHKGDAIAHIAVPDSGSATAAQSALEPDR